MLKRASLRVLLLPAVALAAEDQFALRFDDKEAAAWEVVDDDFVWRPNHRDMRYAVGRVVARWSPVEKE